MDYILVTAEKFGYGPIVTCLNVIKEFKRKLKDRKEKLYFLGTSIAKEQAKSSCLFDKIIECKTYDYKELSKHKKLFENAKAVLSCENQFGAIYAKQINAKNVYFIDNLVWMWDRITPGLENVDGYFISETFSSKDNFEKIGKNVTNPIFIGPLRKINNKHYKETNTLIINFGGAESFMIDKAIVDKFYKKVLNEILTPKVLKGFSSIYVSGGSGVIETLRPLYKECPKVKIKTLPNKQFLNKLHHCSHIIMSSGLGNFIESVGIGKKILFIPPINYSQLLQLIEYKKLDLGFDLLNWEDYKFYANIPNLLDEETGVNLVIENAKKYLKCHDHLLSKRVEEFIDSNKQEMYFEKRNNYISQFSENSAKIVVNTILRGIDNENTK